MDMKLFLRRLAAFACFASIVYLLLLMIWGNIFGEWKLQNILYRRAGHGHSFSRFREADTTKNVDLLFLGSSHAYRGFDTRIFDSAGYRSFNLGSSSQTPLQTRVLLHRYLNGLNPKLAILEVYPKLFATDGVESALDVLANDEEDHNSFRMVSKMHNPTVWNSWLYSSVRERLGWERHTREPANRRLDQYIRGGYVERDLEYFSHTRQQPQSWSIRADQEEAFNEVLSMLRSRGIPYLLVFAPITDSIYYAHSRREDFDSLMASHGPYINFNLVISMDDSLHFYDEHHLNQKGVERFNAALLDTLRRLWPDGPDSRYP
ncbi:MAG: hypothetical protein ACK5XV_03035 [Flavobacteriales bacterium]